MIKNNIQFNPERYQITYHFDWGEVTQQKVIVPHDEWLAYREANKRLILSNKKEEDPDSVDKELVEYFKARYGDLFFTDRSPLMQAKTDGALITPHVNCKVTFEKIN